MSQTIMTIVLKLEIGKEHAHACCVSQSTVKISFNRDWRFDVILYQIYWSMYVSIIISL